MSTSLVDFFSQRRIARCAYCDATPTHVLTWTDRRALAIDGPSGVRSYRQTYCAAHIEQGRRNITATTNGVILDPEHNPEALF